MQERHLVIVRIFIFIVFHVASCSPQFTSAFYVHGWSPTRQHEPIARHYVIGESAVWNDTFDPWQDFPRPSTKASKSSVQRQDYEAFEAFDNRQYFGSVTRSFLTLMQVLSLLLELLQLRLMFP